MSTTWTDLLNELNRDVARDRPRDVVQWGANWFQNRLSKEVSEAFTNTPL